MKEKHRQLILLIGVMALLTAVFIVVISTSPDVLDIDLGSENASANQSINLPEPLQSSIEGLQSLYRDSSSGINLLQSRDGP